MNERLKQAKHLFIDILKSDRLFTIKTKEITKYITHNITEYDFLNENINLYCKYMYINVPAFNTNNLIECDNKKLSGTICENICKNFICNKYHSILIPSIDILINMKVILSSGIIL